MISPRGPRRQLEPPNSAGKGSTRSAEDLSLDQADKDFGAPKKSKVDEIERAEKHLMYNVKVLQDDLNTIRGDNAATWKDEELTDYGVYARTRTSYEEPALGSQDCLDECMAALMCVFRPAFSRRRGGRCVAVSAVCARGRRLVVSLLCRV